MIHRKVRFKGEEYWENNEYGVHKLSPLNHYNKAGELLASLTDISYAVIEDDEILRFQEVIGNISDIEEIKE